MLLERFEHFLNNRTEYGWVFVDLQAFKIDIRHKERFLALRDPHRYRGLGGMVPLRHLMDTIALADSKGCIGIQVADYIAYIANQYFKLINNLSVVKVLRYNTMYLRDRWDRINPFLYREKHGKIHGYGLKNISRMKWVASEAGLTTTPQRAILRWTSRHPPNNYLFNK
jgi:hypothetical protein